MFPCILPIIADWDWVKKHWAPLESLSKKFVPGYSYFASTSSWEYLKALLPFIGPLVLNQLCYYWIRSVLTPNNFRQCTAVLVNFSTSSKNYINKMDRHNVVAQTSAHYGTYRMYPTALPVGRGESHCVTGSKEVPLNSLSVSKWTCCKVRIALIFNHCRNCSNYLTSVATIRIWLPEGTAKALAMTIISVPNVLCTDDLVQRY
jgi:hypothetical protein